jgi:hypothetical protein
MVIGIYAMREGTSGTIRLRSSQATSKDVKARETKGNKPQPAPMTTQANETSSAVSFNHSTRNCKFGRRTNHETRLALRGTGTV